MIVVSHPMWYLCMFRPFAMTEFFPTYARYAFPCFDEPGYKTPYNISIMRRWDQTTLSNMPLLSSVRT